MCRYTLKITFVGDPSYKWSYTEDFKSERELLKTMDGLIDQSVKTYRIDDNATGLYYFSLEEFKNR